jgi:hypothetical protein
VLSRDAERSSQTPRPVGACTGFDPHHGLARADEHGVALPLPQAHDVEAVVHTVNEEDVRVPGGAKEASRSAREPYPGMASSVARTSIRLGLDHAHGADRTSHGRDEVRPDEIPRDLQRVTREELARSRAPRKAESTRTRA